MKKIGKGEYGYINRQKIYTIVRTVILFALALGIYAIGYYNTGSNKNLLTIVAILGLLPASKSCVNMIMFLRFKSLDEALYSEFTDLTGRNDEAELLFENVLTTTEKSYYLPAIYYKNHTIVSYCENKNSEACAIVEKHLKEAMKIEKIEVTVKVFKDKAQFVERVKGLLLTEQEDDNAVKNHVYSTIKAISL